MPITMNRFKCSNGHSFEANAKLRTRCPHCGVMTKRTFQSVVEPVIKTEDESPIENNDDHPEPKHKVTGPVLIRQGRPRMAAKKPAPKKPEVKAKPKIKAKPKGTTLIGSKVSAGLVKTTTLKGRGHLPTIKRKPIKTAVARGIAGHEQKPRFADEVVKKYGWF